MCEHIRILCTLSAAGKIVTSKLKYHAERTWHDFSMQSYQPVTQQTSPVYFLLPLILKSLCQDRTTDERDSLHTEELGLCQMTLTELFIVSTLTCGLLLSIYKLHALFIFRTYKSVSNIYFLTALHNK